MKMEGACGACVLCVCSLSFILCQYQQATPKHTDQLYPVLPVYQLKILDLIINTRKTRQVTCANENITTNGTYKPGGHVAG